MFVVIAMLLITLSASLSGAPKGQRRQPLYQTASAAHDNASGLQSSDDQEDSALRSANRTRRGRGSASSHAALSREILHAQRAAAMVSFLPELFAVLPRALSPEALTSVGDLIQELETDCARLAAEAADNEDHGMIDLKALTTKFQDLATRLSSLVIAPAIAPGQLPEQCYEHDKQVPEQCLRISRKHRAFFYCQLVQPVLSIIACILVIVCAVNITWWNYTALEALEASGGACPELSAVNHTCHEASTMLVNSCTHFINQHVLNQLAHSNHFYEHMLTVCPTAAAIVFSLCGLLVSQNSTSFAPCVYSHFNELACPFNTSLLMTPNHFYTPNIPLLPSIPSVSELMPETPSYSAIDDSKTPCDVNTCIASFEVQCHAIEDLAYKLIQHLVKSDDQYRILMAEFLALYTNITRRSA